MTDTGHDDRLVSGEGPGGASVGGGPARVDHSIRAMGDPVVVVANVSLRRDGAKLARGRFYVVDGNHPQVKQDLADGWLELADLTEYDPADL